VSKYFPKGKPILIEGRIQNNNYTDRDGVQHYQDQIIADKVSFLLSDTTKSGNQPPAQNPQNNFIEQLSDSELPF
jgi:single-strand DNA-binding protein